MAISPVKKRSKLFDPEEIIMGEELSDNEIHLAQQLLKKQFPALNGLQSTLLQGKQMTLTESEVYNKVQIIHCNSCHQWIVASTVQCNFNQVRVYESLFTYCDKETERVIANLFQCDSSKLTITVSRSHKQKGTVDCGLFAIANATAIEFGKNPSKLRFKQEALRSHLVNCYNKNFMSPFPCI